MTTEVKKRGRPPNRLAAEKEAVNLEKEAAAKRAVDPLFEGEIFDDRRCRERVRILKARRVEADKKVTGTGSLNLTEADTLLNSLIECEDFTANNANAEKEKEEQSKQLTQAIQKDALITMRARVELGNDVETVSGNESSSPVPKKYSPKKPAARFINRKVEPVDEYLEGKKIQQLKELDMKMEMHRETMLDNAAERSIRREFLEFDREKLRMEDADKARRFELEKEGREKRFQLEKEERDRQFDLMRDVMLSKK
ncbi:hypothetical protein RvY_07963 [Ramazzottius varieornatus]|uniref:Uncharacterized protein n=1 Tax=Ramazzottius varieornatus TaxID=947166 RepID=A0A1D1V8Z8_RAMVA|nr:hypothetical protein RvY_07963 [Ramazzottius varieornatus]